MKKYIWFEKYYPFGSSIIGYRWVIKQSEVEIIAETDSCWKIRYWYPGLLRWKTFEEWIMKHDKNKLEEIKGGEA